MTSLDGSIPRQEPASGSQTLEHEGAVMKYDGSGELVETAAVGDAAVGVLDQAVVDVEQNTRQTRSGEQVGVFFLGSGQVVNVASTSGTTYAKGDTVYLSSTSGLVNATDSGSDTPIGTYVGPDGYTASETGDTVVVVLNE